jgi:hypothetical protein
MNQNWCEGGRRLERCLRAPTLLCEIRGPDRIACLLCSRLFKRISLHLPEHAAELSTEIEETQPEGHLTPRAPAPN